MEKEPECPTAPTTSWTILQTPLGQPVAAQRVLCPPPPLARSLATCLELPVLPEHTEAPLWLWDLATARSGEVHPVGRTPTNGKQEEGRADQGGTSVRSGKRLKKTRKYDIITTPAERVEMAPLNEEDDEDEDSTVFDIKYSEELLLLDEQRNRFLEVESILGEDAMKTVEGTTKDLGYYVN
ncbi:Membrane protein FAM174B [Myotis davidii]|uniref:Membrane protein FAM174B n=1 Tax=Myotis davidii TaxID=225400 RepID=L5LEZ4_MYODS|nr:Membrane protein FAM174B [Myotis davidii]